LTAFLIGAEPAETPPPCNVFDESQLHPPDTVTDEALMLAVKNGDVDGLSVLFERHHRPLFGFFYRMLGDRAAAEDLVQDVFVRVLKYRHTFRPQFSFEPWLFQIARNARRDFARNLRAMVHLDDDLEVEAPAPGPGARFEQQQDAALLRKALGRLPADKRELIVLSRYRGMDYAQLAALLDADAGTIRVRLHRAIRQLGEIFCQLQRSTACAARTSKTG
jgi:RNA polymerase sigma factor (sigma-70 family)